MIREEQRPGLAAKIQLSIKGVVQEFGKHPVNLSPGVVWDGCVYGYSGYGKANRELLHRVANTMAVELHPAFMTSMDLQSQVRLEPYLRIRTAPHCPYLRFFGPDRTTLEPRPRICYTMMETTEIHADMVSIVNRSFDELWCPTLWNLTTFRDSGVKIKGRVIPLGVDPLIYRPMKEKPKLPTCTLLTTRHRGLKASPDGLIVLTVGVPSGRKGFDVLARAFEKAFAGNKDAHLVVATTHATSNVPELESLFKLKSKIWTLEGATDEHQMAAVYNASSCYASASRGEGWNLPAIEAAACGVPVILPAASSHPEVTGGKTWLFKAEGVSRMPGIERISPWYKDMTFTKFGKKSIADLAEMMLQVSHGGPEVARRVRDFRAKVLNEWSWDRAAALMSKRLLELQP